MLFKMIKRINFQTALLILSIICFSGCLKKQPKKLPSLERIPTIYNPDFQEESDNVVVKVKKLNSTESSDLLTVNTLKQGFLPIVITVKNNSNNILYFNPEATNLPIVSPEFVAKQCHWKNFELTSSTGYLAVFYFWQALIPIAYGSYWMRSRNCNITEAVCKHAINTWESIKILPLETLNKILFLEEYNTPKSFLLKLFNKDQKEIKTFIVELNKK